MKNRRLSLIARMCYAFILLSIIIAVLAITPDDRVHTGPAAAKFLPGANPPDAENNAALVRKFDAERRILAASRAGSKVKSYHR
ncbi:MAG: hypothetical protein K4571_10850 [Deltaproteobacteria bacterium]